MSIMIISSLKKLCEIPDNVGKLVIAVSVSGDDLLKVSVGKIDEITNDYYQERHRTFEGEFYEQAIAYAKRLSKNINTYQIYEIRVFQDNTSECIRLL